MDLSKASSRYHLRPVKIYVWDTIISAYRTLEGTTGGGARRSLRTLVLRSVIILVIIGFDLFFWTSPKKYSLKKLDGLNILRIARPNLSMNKLIEHPDTVQTPEGAISIGDLFLLDPLNDPLLDAGRAFCQYHATKR